MYYAVISVAVVMFGVQFFFNRKYQKRCGSSLRAMLVFALGNGAVGTAVLLIINRFALEFTPFSFFMAFLMAANTVMFTFCSLKALGKINLSLYSVFSMLGGMVLPFIVGIAFFGEELTAAKIICIILIAAALFLTVKKGESKGGFVWYAGIFLLNGMSGVISKIEQAAPFRKTSDAGFSVLAAVLCVVICAVALIFVKGEKIKPDKIGLLSIGGAGILSRVGNYLLLLALSHLPASAQYPFVTGGVMIVSTVICFFTDEKPKKRELCAVAVSLAGILALVLL